MGFKEQMDKLKENWFIILLVIIGFVLLVFMTGGGANVGMQRLNYANDSTMMDYSPAASYGGSYDNYKSSTSDFAPEVEERKIVKNANLSLEIKWKEFKDVSLKINSIANTSDSYILSENITSRKSGSKDIYTGNYTIKVESSKLDDLLNQLKEVGKVTSFNQSGNDITGNFTKTSLEIELEKDRLDRYLEIYQTTNEDGKIQLIDKIFNQEKRIKYLEDSLKNMDQRVEYSTISLTVREKYNYANIVLVKLSDLLKVLVGSVNTVLKILFAIIPFIIFIYLIVLGVRVSRKKKK
jgi:hypothetical protein